MMMQTKKSKCREAVREYILQNDPYEKTTRLGFNVAAMYRYAKKNNRKISDLTAEEANMFIVK